jgi:hypothetical protein
MYKPTTSMPLASYQVISPADNQVDYQSGQIVRFTIPRNIGFFDPHCSRVQFEVATTGNNYKMCFGQDCGVASLIDMVRVSQNGVVLSETTEYSTLANMLCSYSESLSVAQRQATQNGARDYVNLDGNKTDNQSQTDTSGVILGEPLNGDSSVAMDRTVKKYQMEMRGIGLFELLSVVPSIALGDVLVELRLASQNVQGIKVHPATSVRQTCAAVTDGDTTITLTPPFIGFTNLSDSPYVNGMRVVLSDADGTGASADVINITGASQTSAFTGATDGQIVLACNAVTANSATKVGVVITRGSDDVVAVDPTTAFVVRKASMVLQVVRPPPQYVESIAKKVQEGLMLDLNTYTTYRSTIRSATRNQTLDIPSFVSRARAVFSVPRFQSGALGNVQAAFTLNNATDYDTQGQYQQLANYRTQVGELYYPNQPVALDQFLNSYHFSAQHIVELEKALRAASIPLRNLKKAKQNFVVPRCLAKYGSSVNLEKGLRVYLQYDGVVNPVQDLDVVTFVNHINRVMITPAGIQVLS